MALNLKSQDSEEVWGKEADDFTIDRLAALVESSELTVTLVDLDSMLRLASSPSLRQLFGAESTGDVLLPCCHERLLLLRGEGRLNGLHYQATFKDAQGVVQDRQVAVQRVPEFDNLALVVVSREAGSFPPRRSAQPFIVGMEGVVLGTVSQDLRVVYVSADIQDLLGFEPTEIAGRLFFDLFDETAVPFVMMALGWALDGAEPVAIQAVAKDRNGSTTPVDVTLLPGGTSRESRESVFLLRGSAPHDADLAGAMRVALERQLWRIAVEIESAGVAPKIGQLTPKLTAPQVGALSSRQLEVLTRLVSGQRVEAIARAMYISQSTVRNHLSAIFAKFRVHSQSELIEHFLNGDREAM
jgi:DNA-binding CsgD family transcriptional regulator